MYFYLAVYVLRALRCFSPHALYVPLSSGIDICTAGDLIRSATHRDIFGNVLIVSAVILAVVHASQGNISKEIYSIYPIFFAIFFAVIDNKRNVPRYLSIKIYQISY